MFRVPRMIRQEGSESNKIIPESEGDKSWKFLLVCYITVRDFFRRDTKKLFSSAPQMSLSYTNSLYFQYFRNFQQLGSDYELDLNS